MTKVYDWPYANEVGQTETIESDVLVLGGGLSGCFAAISAAKKEKNIGRWRKPLSRKVSKLQVFQQQFRESFLLLLRL